MKSTTSAGVFADCIRDHLDDAQLAELLDRLPGGRFLFTPTPGATSSS